MEQMNNKIIGNYPKGLYAWYDFKQNSKILCVGEETAIIANYLYEKKLDVVKCSYEQILSEDDFKCYTHTFTYILLGHALEVINEKEKMLIACRNLVTSDGRILLTMDNRFSIRAFAGDRDPYTNRNYDGIENYRQVRKEDYLKGRQYSREEIRTMITRAGIGTCRFFSVFPSTQYPQLIYSEDFIPNEEMGTRYFPLYENPDSVFLEEEFLLNDLARNGMFHEMANSYFIECSLDGQFNDAAQVTLSLDRGEDKALTTIIRHSNVVEKKAIYDSGKEQLIQLYKHSHELKKRGICVVRDEMVDDIYQMPFVEAEIGVKYFKKIYSEDQELFVKKLDEFWQIILQSSEHEEKPIDGNMSQTIWGKAKEAICLKRGYIDLVPINCFYMDEKFVFFDQEFCFDNYPAQVMMVRAIYMIFSLVTPTHNSVSMNDMFERYELDKHLDLWTQMSNEFTSTLRNQKSLLPFYEKHRANYETLNSNRQRMNYSATEYHKLFIDIFRNTDNRKILLFGSGNFAKKYLAIYQDDYPASYIIDNNRAKWNTQMSGVPICGPDILDSLEQGTYKVIICIKNFESVRKQLDELGVTNYAIFDTNMEYPKKIHRMKAECVQSSEAPKKYHVGYMAGVYDLFHIGHLNLFKRAKEQCDYLIVGVVTDEGVKRNKKTVPFIPFEERLEIVQSCKYVDEAVEIPLEYSDTRDAYRMYHFDVQFSGSDYVDDPSWVAKKEFLNKQGADLVFFPYTKGTSSTKLKEVINKKLV